MVPLVGLALLLAVPGCDDGSGPAGAVDACSGCATDALLCEPLASSCVDGMLRTCAPSGASYNPDQPCPDGSSCVQTADKAVCRIPVCQPGAHCDGLVRIACSDDGQHVLGTFDCAKEGLGCQAGKCVFVPPPPPELKPQLVLGPTPLLFDGVKPGQSQERTLLLHNAGNAPLVLSKLWFDKVSAGQFAFAPSYLGATATPAEPVEIAPGDTLALDLALGLNTATTAPIAAELHAVSNDPDQPELVAPLAAQPGQGGCVVTFASEVHDFGVVAAGG